MRKNMSISKSKAILIVKNLVKIMMKIIVKTNLLFYAPETAHKKTDPTGSA